MNADNATGGVTDKYYYAHNHLYSCVALLDNNGAVIERYEYNAYGKPTIYNANFSQTRTISQYNNDILFTGREVDFLDAGSLTLQYNRNRYYDYDTGRWLTQDPLGVVPNGRWPNSFEIALQYVTGLNSYIYVGDQCLVFSDPFGLYNADVHNDDTEWLAGDDSLNFNNCGELTPEKIGEVTEKPDHFWGGHHPWLLWNLKYHFPTREDLENHKKDALKSCDPKRIGEYLHALEDSFSHQRGKTDRSGWEEPPICRWWWHLTCKNEQGKWDPHWPDITDTPGVPKKKIPPTKNPRPKLYDKMIEAVRAALREISDKCCPSRCAVKPMNVTPAF